MATVINNQDPGGQWAGMVGGGLTSGLQNLVQRKMQQEQTQRGLETLLGPDKAAQFSQLPPELLKVVLPQQMQQQKQLQMMQSLMGGQQFDPQQQVLDQQMPIQDTGIQQPTDQLGVSPVQFEDGLAAPRLEEIQPQQQQRSGIEALQGRPFSYNQELARGLAITGGDTKLASKMADSAQKIHEQTKKEGAERKKALTEQENKMWDKADPFINAAMNSAEKAKTSNQDLKRLIEVDKDLTSPGYNAFLENSGFNIDALKDPSSTEFNSIKMNFMRNMKEIFGGNVSNTEVTAFLKTLPDLSQSPEGRKRVISNMMRLNNMAIQKNKAIKQAIQQNRGVPTRDIRFKVDKIMKSRTNKVMNQFRSDLSRPVPKFSKMDRLITSGASASGAVLGAIPKLIGGLTGALKGLGRLG